MQATLIHSEQERMNKFPFNGNVNALPNDKQETEADIHVPYGARGTCQNHRQRNKALEKARKVRDSGKERK